MLVTIGVVLRSMHPCHHTIIGHTLLRMRAGIEGDGVIVPLTTMVGDGREDIRAGWRETFGDGDELHGSAILDSVDGVQHSTTNL